MWLLSRLAIPIHCEASRLWLGRDGNRNKSALFEPHIIAMFVRQRIFDADISMPMVGPVNANLCLFGLVRARRWDDFFDGSGYGDAWLF